MADRPLDGCNEIIEDNAPRWLITVSLVPHDMMRGVLTETRIIETEPSLWWRSEKWQEFEEVEVNETECKTVPIYKMCLVLNTEFIG